jgi:peptidoglycan/LPS O-acetylase OafA/YrhL
MIDPAKSKASHLLIAVPAAAVAGGLTLVLGFGFHEPVGEILRELPFAVLEGFAVGLYVLPFAAAAGVPTYFILRRFRRITGLLCALVGISVGLLVGLAEPKLPMWSLVCALTGLVAAIVGYGALRLLSERVSPNPTAERDVKLPPI